MLSDLLVDGSPDGTIAVVMAHGAGGPMDSSFMNAVAGGLATAGHRVVRFEFPYMRDRRAGGTRRPPNRAPILEAAWREVVAELGPASDLVIGGKSMGGRIASRVADELGVRGLVCLGYPFHPPGRPERLRTKHLRDLRTPTLIVQGTRDRLGTPEDVESYSLSPSIDVRWIEDGDHSFVPRKASGRGHAETLVEAIGLVDRFLGRLGARGGSQPPARASHFPPDQGARSPEYR